MKLEKAKLLKTESFHTEDCPTYLEAVEQANLYFEEYRVQAMKEYEGNIAVRLVDLRPVGPKPGGAYQAHLSINIYEDLEPVKPSPWK